MKNFILTLVIAIVSSVNVFGQSFEFDHIMYYNDNTFIEFDAELINNEANVTINDVFKDNLVIKQFDNLFLSTDGNNGQGVFTYTSSNNVVTIKAGHEGQYTYILTFTGGHVLSVGSQPEVSNLLIYPNPVQDVLNIRFDSYETVDVVVTDLNGRIVFNETSSVSVSVDLSNQPSGIYLVKVGSETRKVVKQ